MAALAPHGATDMCKSADDLDEAEFVTEDNRHDWSQDLNKTCNDSNRSE